jgi:hypothetical protein
MQLPIHGLAVAAIQTLGQPVGQDARAHELAPGFLLKWL